jgi:ABC-2 type transport system ATP-binding protein
MIHQGRKVLDGTLTDIQRRYPVSSVRLRLAEGAALPARLPGVSANERKGSFDVLTLDGGCAPQALLRQVSADHDVEHFEIVRPTLHDIFVNIARPERVDAGLRNGDAGAGAGRP